MSFRWSISDIIAGAGFISRVGKALKAPDPTIMHGELKEQLTVLAGLSGTLDRLGELLRVSSGSEWEEDIIQHGENIKLGIEKFELIVKRYDELASDVLKGIEGLKTGHPRTVQYTIADHVNELQETTSRSRLVLDVFISLQSLSSLLENSGKTTHTENELKDEIQRVCCLLPSIASGITGFNEGRADLSKGLINVQQHAEFLVRDDLDDSYTSLLDLQVALPPLSEPSRSQCQENLCLAIEELRTCCTLRLDDLLGRRLETGAEAEYIQISSWEKAINFLFQIVDTELRGALCVAIALSSKKSPEKQHFFSGEPNDIKIIVTASLAPMLYGLETPRVSLEVEDIDPGAETQQVSLDVKDIGPEVEAPQVSLDVKDIGSEVEAPQRSLDVKDIGPEAEEPQVSLQVKDIDPEVEAPQTPLDVKDIGPEVEATQVSLKVEDIDPEVEAPQVSLDVKDIGSEVEAPQRSLDVKDIGPEAEEPQVSLDAKHIEPEAEYPRRNKSFRRNTPERKLRDVLAIKIPREPLSATLAENRILPSAQHINVKLQPGSNASSERAASQTAFSKHTWGSKSTESNFQLAPPLTKYSHHMFQRHAKSALSQEVVQEPVEKPLGVDQYSFALARWVKEADDFEMLLNTGAQNKELDGESPDLAAVDFPEESHALEIARLPQIFLDSTTDWEDPDNSTTMISAMAKIEIPSLHSRALTEQVGIVQT